MADDGNVVHILHTGFPLMSGSAVMVYNVNRRELSTQLWGAPVLNTNVEEV